jgi:2-alkyl-3-oxoalkanoate reductase
MKVLVTGGTGFLGNSLAGALIKKGHTVVSYSRGDSPDLRDLGAEVIRGDVADGEAFALALRGCDALMHVAAKPGIWGSFEDYYRANVTGTENALKGCRSSGIKLFVYTSSPSVIFGNAHQSGTNESANYPEKYLAHYPRTKAIAERLVLKANGADLATISLRPHLIWGPGDPHFIPRLIERAKAGTLRIVGDGTNLVDSVYVDNAVDAHILALEHLSCGCPTGGRAYFITNGEPLPMADLMNRFLAAAGIPPVTKKIPAALAYAAGAVMELVSTAMKRRTEPKMTRFLARELSCAHWYDISAARRDLGYEPAVTIDEGMKRLSSWLEERGLKEGKTR